MKRNTEKAIPNLERDLGYVNNDIDDSYLQLNNQEEKDKLFIDENVSLFLLGDI